MNMRSLAVLVVALGTSAGSARAQTDEVQVYDGEIAAPGKFNLTLHNNWIAEGRNTPAFRGGLVLGFGLTDTSDHLTLKLILARDLN